MPVHHILNMQNRSLISVFDRLLVNPPKTLAQSPARMASTSAAINYIISQIANNNTAETALNQVCVCVSPFSYVLVCSHNFSLLTNIMCPLILIVCCIIMLYVIYSTYVGTCMLAYNDGATLHYVTCIYNVRRWRHIWRMLTQLHH